MFTMENLNSYLDHLCIYATQEPFVGVVAGETPYSIEDCETRGDRVVLGDCSGEINSNYRPISGDCADLGGAYIDMTQIRFVGDCGTRQV